MASTHSEDVPPLPIALVGAFVSAGRPIMPKDGNGVPRTEEVRDTLTRMMVDADFYFAYSARLQEAFRVYDLDVPFDESVLPLPEYNDAEIAANGFANVHNPDTLAAWALDPSAFEGINQLLFDEIPAGKARPKEIGPWLKQAEKRWPVTPYEPPLWLQEKLSAATSSPPTTTISSTSMPEVSKYAGRRRLSYIAICLAAITLIVGVIGLGSYRSSERIHRSLDQFESNTAIGHFTTAVAHLRDAQEAAANSLLPMSDSVKIRLEGVTDSSRLLEQILNSDNLPDSESALRIAVSMPSLDRDPSYRFALGLILRRAGKLADASAEFDRVLSKLGEKPQDEIAPGQEESSERPSAQLTNYIFGDKKELGMKVRITHAENLIELDNPKLAKAWLKPIAEGKDHRPFGPNFLLWLTDRVQITDATLQDIVSGRQRATTTIELREHAYACLYRKHYARAADLFNQLFASADFAKIPPVEGAEYDFSYYHAAGAALRAGRFGDLDTPEVAEITKWRAMSLDWAQKDKQRWLEAFIKSPDKILPTIYWYSAVRHDKLLGVSRDLPHVQELKPNEQKGWHSFWDELDARFQGLRPLRDAKVDWDIPI